MGAFKLIVSGILAAVMLGAIIYGFAAPPGKLPIQDLLKEPWMITSLFDVYTGIALFWFWVVHREASFCIALLWLPFFIVLGNLATALYVFIHLWKTKGEKEMFWNGQGFSDAWNKN